MIFGDKKLFAIEISIKDTVEDWIFGNFMFWFKNLPLGNSEDDGVDLKGCMNWLKDFIEVPRNRFEKNLYTIPKTEAFKLLVENVLASYSQNSGNEFYENTFSRFHISHLGMSSFDDLILLLIENESRQQRCIWAETGKELDEIFLPAKEMQKVASKALTWFKKI